MSVHVMSWVLRHSPERLGNRLVLLVYADHASEDGTRSYPSIDTVAEEARLSRAQTIRCRAALEAHGALVRVGEGPRGTIEYRVVMGSQDATPREPEGVASTASGDDRMRPEPSFEPSNGVASPNGSATPARTSIGKVAGKVATAAEGDLARDVLAEWNHLTGQDLRSRDWLAKIVMRIREYPEATLADHRYVIERNLAHPWWDGPPTPSVIYGNGAQFERAVTTARQAQDNSIERTAEAVQRGIDAVRGGTT